MFWVLSVGPRLSHYPARFREITSGGQFPRQFEATYSLSVERREIAAEDLSQIVKDEDAKGAPLLCAVLYQVTIPYAERFEPQLVWHIFVGLEIKEKAFFATRVFGSNQIVWQTIGQLQGIHRIAQSASTDQQDRKVECLLHRLA